MVKQTDLIYETPSQPRQVRLDTTTRCNAKCPTCHRFLTDRKGEMLQKMVGGILDAIAKLPQPLTEIIPVNYGEFFMREDWYDILVMIAQKLPYTNLVLPTNGSKLEEYNVKKLCSIPILDQVNFSINAYFEDTYEAFTGLKGSKLDVIRKAIATIKVMRPDITIVTSMVFNPAYQTEIEKDLFLKVWVDHANVAILTASSAGRTEPPEIITSLPCRSLFSDLVIGFDGKLSSCCFDAGFTMDLGEFKGDILEAWHNPKLEKLRQIHNEHRRSEIELCAKCTFA